MVTTLEIDESEILHTCESCGKAITEGMQYHLDEDGIAVCDDCYPKTEPETEVPPTVELTQDEQIAAYQRKEQILREAQTELNNLEEKQSAARSTANSLKDPIADARAKVEKLISCDVSGFLRWEKEQELPLLQKAEEAANAWKHEPVSALDVTAKDKEKLAECFLTCGEVSDWLGKDFPDKKPGLSGEKTKERLRDAINKISGLEACAWRQH